ncbi:EamA family transporter [Nocardia sp. NBC_01499]|uniref:EamA family transporter n=1 Tax=Nocardia sp. NBC_01499 TaxID=2903597 RepID=UPI003864D2BE
MSIAGVCTMLASGLSTQLGAAIGSLAFPMLGPVGVIAVRQYVAAAVLLILGRPRLRSFTRRQWGLVLLLAAGILSSALPFLADLFTPRRVPAAAFGLFMSVNPVLAAAVGVLVLGQQLDVAAWLSIAAIIAANAISILAKPRHA